MKIIFMLFVILSLVPVLVPGQNFTVQVDQAPYASLSNPTLLTDTEVWGGDEWWIPIGFNFDYFGTEYSTCSLWEGTIYFTEDTHFFDAFGASFLDLAWHLDLPVSHSKAQYQQEGLPGERILKLEYLEVGFWDGDEEDVISFQIWLYEQHGIIEVRIGPGQVDPAVYAEDGWEGPYIGMTNTEAPYYLYLENDPADPEIYTEDDLTDGLTGTPTEGTVYRFLPDSLVASPASIQELEMEVTMLSDAWSVRGKNLAKFNHWTLLDLNGQALAKGLCNPGETRIPHPKTRSGVWVVHFGGPRHQYSIKVFVN